MKQINRVPVTRDANGYWMHPDLKKYVQGDLIVEFVGMEINYVEFESDCTVEQSDKYFVDGSPDISDWNPTPPAGENWYCAYIMDHDDAGCPVAMFVRENI